MDLSLKKFLMLKEFKIASAISFNVFISDSLALTTSFKPFLIPLLTDSPDTFTKPVFLFFKTKKTRRKSGVTPIWEKYFIDVVLLGVSIYLLFNYNKQISTLSAGVINGDGIDPVIFINATLFLFACGMLMLRIIFYIVRLVFRIGEKKYSPVTYAGFVQIIRTRKASGVISIFLVMTVAMSIFNAGLARTINSNKEDRLRYECGTDVRIQEKWKITMIKQGSFVRWKYTEPDYSAYQSLIDDGTFKKATKVMISDRSSVIANGKQPVDVKLMGINTKEFGETASLKDGLTEEHWYNYLNALAAEPEGAIISRNLADFLEVKVGDLLVCQMKSPKITGISEIYASAPGKVVAIVDAWPGFNSYSYITNEDGKTVEKPGYFIVMNYTNTVNCFNLLPYEVWTKTDSGREEVVERLNESYGDRTRYVEDIRSWRDELREEKSTAIIQITNGIFTADFLVALLLCIIGYMIYWITSIRDRELLFGIYRAMGIRRGEINRMIGLEQIFLSLMSILAGVLAGSLALRLFVRVFAAVYLPQKHSVSVFISSQVKDLLEIGCILLFVVLICVVWIRRIVKSLNITEALKLGDD